MLFDSQIAGVNMAVVDVVDIKVLLGVVGEDRVELEEVLPTVLITRKASHIDPEESQHYLWF